MPPAVVLSGTQQVTKFAQKNPDDVRIYMALYRLESKNVDLVVTFNIPVKSDDGDAVGEEEVKKAEEDFMVCVKSLEIVDYGLFVPAPRNAHSTHRMMLQPTATFFSSKND